MYIKQGETGADRSFHVHLRVITPNPELPVDTGNAEDLSRDTYQHELRHKLRS